VALVVGEDLAQETSDGEGLRAADAREVVKLQAPDEHARQLPVERPVQLAAQRPGVLQPEAPSAARPLDGAAAKVVALLLGLRLPARPAAQLAARHPAAAAARLVQALECKGRQPCNLFRLASRPATPRTQHDLLAAQTAPQPLVDRGGDADLVRRTVQRRHVRRAQPVQIVRKTTARRCASESSAPSSPAHKGAFAQPARRGTHGSWCSGRR